MLIHFTSLEQFKNQVIMNNPNETSGNLNLIDSKITRKKGDLKHE